MSKADPLARLIGSRPHTRKKKKAKRSAKKKLGAGTKVTYLAWVNRRHDLLCQTGTMMSPGFLGPNGVPEFWSSPSGVSGLSNLCGTVNCVTRWHSLAQRIAVRLIVKGFCLSTDESVPSCVSVSSVSRADSAKNRGAGVLKAEKWRPKRHRRNLFFGSRFCHVPLTSKAADARRCLRSIGAGAARLPIVINPDGGKHAHSPTS